jgi:FMN phosphatase YigB (HAD superfamily)
MTTIASHGPEQLEVVDDDDEWDKGGTNNIGMHSYVVVTKTS